MCSGIEIREEGGSLLLVLAHLDTPAPVSDETVHLRFEKGNPKKKKGKIQTAGYEL